VAGKSLKTFCNNLFIP